MPGKLDLDPRFDKNQHDDEIHDLSPNAFRFIAALLIGVAILALAGVL